MDAVKNFKKNSLDFVYIDSNHDFEFIVNDIIEWSKIVRPSGIVSGHDYWETGNDYPCHIKIVVNAYVGAYKISPLFLIGKKYEFEDNERTWDKRRSWMFVKT